MPTEEQKVFLIDKIQKEVINELTDEEAGKIFKAIFEYETTKQIPKLEKTLKLVFMQFKIKLDFYEESYNKKCLKNKENIQKYWEKKKGEKSDTNVYDRIQSNTNVYKIKEKEKEKEKEKIKVKEKIKENINNINNNSSCCNNNNIHNNTIYDFVEQNFGRTLNPIEYEEISSWDDNELTRYAIKQSVLSNKCVVKYISRILNAFQRENIKTIQQAQEREREYMEAKNKTKKSYKTSTERMNEVFERFLADEEAEK